MNRARSSSPDDQFGTHVRTPFATLGITTDGRAVTRVAYLPLSQSESPPTDAIAERAVREVERYVDDASFRFTVPLAPQGTVFQRRTWDAIRAIPAGESRTYGELAKRLMTAPRAVGQACGANPVALIVPCHRVVGSTGALGGFMGKEGSDATFGSRELNLIAPVAAKVASDPLSIKRWLLVHEGYRFGR